MGPPEVIGYGHGQLSLALVQAIPSLLLDDSQPLPGFSVSHLLLSVLHPASRSGEIYPKPRLVAVTPLHE